MGQGALVNLPLFQINFFFKLKVWVDMKQNINFYLVFLAGIE